MVRLLQQFILSFSLINQYVFHWTLTHQNLGIFTIPLITLVSGSVLKRTVVGGHWCVKHEKTKADSRNFQSGPRKTRLVKYLGIISLGNGMELESTPQRQAGCTLQYRPLNQPVTVLVEDTTTTQLLKLSSKVWGSFLHFISQLHLTKHFIHSFHPSILSQVHKSPTNWPALIWVAS